MTRVPAEYKEANLRQIAVNDEYITYGLKQGHIRVLHRFSEARALLKGHSGPIADICFVGNDTLVAGGQDGTLFAWKLTVHDGDNAISPVQIVNVKFSPGCESSPVAVAAIPGRSEFAVAVGNAVMVLHPSQFTSKNGAEIEIDPLVPHPAHKMPNFPVQDVPTAVTGSPDGLFLAAGSRHGRVYVAKFSEDDGGGGGGGTLQRRAQLDIGSPISAVNWLRCDGSTSTLLVSTANGAHQTLFHSADGGGTFQQGDTVVLESSGPLYVHTSVVEAQQLVVMADTPRKQVYTLHWSGGSSSSSTTALRFDYLARFKIGLSILNFTALWNPDAGEEGAVELNCVQTEAIQQYFLDPALCSVEVAEEEEEEGESSEVAFIPISSVASAGSETAVVHEEVPITAAPKEEEEEEEEEDYGMSGFLAAAAAALPPSPLINGAVTRADSEQPSTREEEAAEKEEQPQIISHPLDAAADASSAPPQPTEVPQPTAATTPLAAAAAAVVTPTKLLTPTDILRSSGGSGAGTARTVVASKIDTRSTTRAQPTPPQPSIKVLQRATTPTPTPASPPPPAAAILTSSPLEERNLPHRDDLSSAVAEEMATVHRKFAGHVSAMYKELLKAMKAEMSAQNAANERILREALAAQAAAVAAERTAVLTEERANMERLLGAISTTLNRDLPSKLGETMRGELNNLSSALAVSLTPAVQQAVSSALPKETAAAVKTALDKQLGVSLQSGLTKPIQEAFRTAFSKQIVPSFENACQSMFVQMDKSFSKGFSEHLDASRGTFAEPAALAASLRESLSETARISGSLSAAAAAAAAGGSGELSTSALDRSASIASSMRSPSAADVKAELRSLMSQSRYEDAFSKALSMQDVAIVGWLCAQADAAVLLSSTPPALSQMVLLSLVQQLAADISTGASSSKLQWIREAALGLNPRDPVLGPHLRPVLDQVHAALGAAVTRMQGADVQSCKLAMHVIHSQMSS